LNRLLTTVTLATVLVASAACSTLDTKPHNDNSTPTPTPTSPFSNLTYSHALRSASMKLRLKQPDPADLQAVLAQGEPAYDAIIDSYLDPSTTGGQTDLKNALQAFYRGTFLMGGTVGATNYDLPPDLATYLILNGRPVTDLATAQYCVHDDGAGNLVMEGVDGTGAPIAAADCDGAPPNERAGIISEGPYLKKFGTLSTVNMRRVSVTHQLFDCSIYPDGDDPNRVNRTNLTPDQWGLNYAGTAADTTDDFMDPSADPSSSATSFVPADPSLDPSWLSAPPAPDRLSKKYQSKLFGASGAECWQCHGHLNWRRPVFTPYDDQGAYDTNRSIANNTADNTDNVESPDQNGALDYCGVLGDTETPPSGDPDDDNIDAGAFDCQNNGKPQAQYFGRNLNTLADFGNAIVDRSLVAPGGTVSAGDRFYACMTTRHYDFVLGKTQGELGLQAAGGSGPAAMDPAIKSKYQTVYESSGWNTKELLRAVLKGPEYLTSQQ